MWKAPILPTAEEAEAIKRGDRDLINHYYMANYDLLRHYIAIYCRNNIRYRDFYTSQDLINQVYVDFQDIQFDCNRYFFCSLRCILQLYLVGGKRKFNQLIDVKSCGSELYLLDKPLSDSGKTFGDMLPYDIPLESVVVDCQKRSERVFNSICEMLTEPQRNVFEYWFFTDLSAREIGIALCRSQQAIEQSKRKMLIKFRKHENDILALYENAGCEIPESILKKVI